MSYLESPKYRDFHEVLESVGNREKQFHLELDWGAVQSASEISSRILIEMRVEPFAYEYVVELVAIAAGRGSLSATSAVDIVDAISSILRWILK